MQRIPRFSILAAAFAASIFFTAPVFAADMPPPAPPSADPAAIPKGEYTLDPSHTNVIFKISHLGFSTFMGRFNTIGGTLKFDGAKPEKSKLMVTIDPASVDTKVDKLNEHLKSPDFFDVAKFKDATFKSTKVEKTGDTTGKVTGNLTLHGVTKPVTLDVTFHGAGPHPFTKAPTMGFGATTTIKRSDFGITTYLPVVGDEVTLIIESEFNQPAPEKKN